MVPRPLTGTRVLDLSRLIPGPYCTLLLADMGADVIKIETPTVGDYARLVPESLGIGSPFEALNRDKRSVALNYRDPLGRELLLRLARSADVIVESSRPGSLARRGLGYDAVRAVNPRIVYCSLSGYGQAGPDRDRVGHDLGYLARSGFLALNLDRQGRPVPPGLQLADMAGGMLAALAILGALLGRARSDEGAHLDVALIDAPLSWFIPFTGMLEAAAEGRPGAPLLPGRLPCYSVYRTADRRYLALAAVEPHFWARFCATIGRRDLVARHLDPNAVPEVAAVIRRRTRADWLLRFEGVDACLEPVSAPDEVPRDPQLRHRGLMSDDGSGLRIGSPLRFARGRRAGPAPALGQDTSAVLREAGLTDDEIAELAAKGVIRVAPPPVPRRPLPVDRDRALR